MFTKVVKNFCPTVDILTQTYTTCGENFTVFPRAKCYPIMYGEWSSFFEQNKKDEVLEKIHDSGAYFVHVWNKMQDFGKKSYKIPFTSEVAYIELAKRFCPRVYTAMEKFFKR